jgi:hypothetical protein
VTATDTRPSVSRPPGRPAMDLDELESANFHRIATLSCTVLRVLRAGGRGKYSSERELRAILAEEGIAYSTADLAPALALAEAVGALVRPPTGLAQPRPGWLPTVADRSAVEPERLRLCRLVQECVRSGKYLPDQAEIAERIAAADEHVPDLAMILQRLVDSGRLRKKQMSESYPVRYASSGAGVFDETDDVAASICQVLRSRTEIGFTSDGQLAGWMLEQFPGEDFDERRLQLAIGQLLRIGRLASPRIGSWQGAGPQPTWLIEPVPYRGD